MRKIVQAKMSSGEKYYVEYKDLPVAVQIKLISDATQERNFNEDFSDLLFDRESEKLEKCCPIVEITRDNIKRYFYPENVNESELINIDDIELDLNTFSPAENCMLLEKCVDFGEFKDEMVYSADIADQFVDDADPKSKYFMLKDGKIVEIDTDTANRQALELLEKHMCI
jgi:hypothetical protein|nr:MAG TPA: hypothetical protein [Caudoviricetes sp.]